jgi:plasmid stabilization system protein ParE
MKIIFKESFIRRLENQVEYIAPDSPVQARKFKTELLNKIKQIPLNPTQNRKSVYFEDNTIRDLIYKGYTIVYRITDTAFEIFGFVKYQVKPIDNPD